MRIKKDIASWMKEFALAEQAEQASEIWICRKDMKPVKVKNMDAARLWVANETQGAPGQKVFRYIGDGAYEWASYVVGTRESVEAQGFCVNQVTNND